MSYDGETMSYDIYIGEPTIEQPHKDDLADGYNKVWVGVQATKLDDAPTFPNDELTGKGSSRHPSYEGWGDFCDKAGLHDLFFDKERGLMREHPGAFVITKKDRDEVREALKKWRAGHPGTVPGFGTRASFEEDIKRGWSVEKNKHWMSLLPPSGEFDGVLARLMWLDFWFSWALKTCSIPTIYNR